MKEELVSFKTAKLAKEKGFSYYTIDLDYILGVYNDGGYLIVLPKSIGEEDILAPTQSLLQRWLREKHNIDLIIKPWTGDKKGEKTYACDLTIFGTSIYNKYRRHNIYEEALEEGLQETLKLIKI